MLWILKNHVDGNYCTNTMYAFGIWNTGYQHYLAFGMESTFMDNMIFGLIKVLPIIVVSYAAGLGVEFIFSITKGHPVSEGYLVTGLLIPLTLPVTVPLWMVALGAVFVHY